MASREFIIDQIARMIEYFNPKDITENKIETYIAGLEEYEHEFIWDAIQAIIETSTFFPRLNEIREQIDKIKIECNSFTWKTRYHAKQTGLRQRLAQNDAVSNRSRGEYLSIAREYDILGMTASAHACRARSEKAENL